MSLTGADLASLQQIRNVATTTGELAITTAGSTARATETAKTEVDDVVRTMTTSFEDTLDRLERVADDADRQVTSSGWQGAARDNAVRASTDFRAGVVRLGADSRTGLTDFSVALDREVTALTEDITGKFTNLMSQAQLSLDGYVQSVSSYGTALQSADQSVTY